MAWRSVLVPCTLCLLVLAPAASRCPPPKPLHAPAHPPTHLPRSALQGNALTGTIPGAWANLTSLRRLVLQPGNAALCPLAPAGTTFKVCDQSDVLCVPGSLPYDPSICQAVPQPDSGGSSFPVVAVAVPCAVVGAAALGAAAWWWRRRRQRRQEAAALRQQASAQKDFLDQARGWAGGLAPSSGWAQECWSCWRARPAGARAAQAERRLLPSRSPGPTPAGCPQIEEAWGLARAGDVTPRPDTSPFASGSVVAAASGEEQRRASADKHRTDSGGSGCLPACFRSGSGDVSFAGAADSLRCLGRDEAEGKAAARPAGGPAWNGGAHSWLLTPLRPSLPLDSWTSTLAARSAPAPRRARRRRGCPPRPPAARPPPAAAAAAGAAAGWRRAGRGCRLTRRAT